MHVFITRDWFHVFTIFKRNYNVGAMILINLFDVVCAIMTSDIYAYILNLTETCFSKNT